MDVTQALAFIRKFGVVLEAAQGPVPSLVDAVAGEAVRGSWWSHPKGREIFAVTRAVRASDEILVCRLIEGKVTVVHPRAWPALVSVAARFPARRLARVLESHTESGRHEARDVPFPEWVPRDVLEAAAKLSEEEAMVEFST